MNLTEHERLMIARRASGEYAVISCVRQIVSEHRKNRNPEDDVFLSFARLTLQKSHAWADYERLARAVLAVIPEPWGTFSRKTEPEPAGTSRPRRRRVVMCGICAGEGHNARTCPNKPDTPTVTHTDGAERLTPGFDPNPPEVDEGKESTT